MSDTPNLTLPLLAAGQALKHVTLNDSLNRLDGIVQLAVISAALTAPTGSPADGDRYIVAASATGAWAGWEGSVAAFIGGAWVRLIPAEGWLVWIADEGRVLVWQSGAWSGPASTLLVQSPFGALIEARILEEDLTGLSGATATTTIAIPDRAIVLGVSTRTTSLIFGATSYDCGDGTTANKFGAILGRTAGSTNIGSVGPTAYYDATPIVLTANGGNFAAGAVRVAIQYMMLAAPVA